MCGYGQKVIWGLFRKRAQLQLLIEIKIMQGWPLTQDYMANVRVKVTFTT